MSNTDLISFLEKELRARRIQYAIATEEAYHFTLTGAIEREYKLDEAKSVALKAREKVHTQLVNRYMCLHETLLILKRELKKETTTAEQRLAELEISHATHHDACGKLIIKNAITLTEARLMTNPYLKLIEMFRTIEAPKPELESQSKLFENAAS